MKKLNFLPVIILLNCWMISSDCSAQWFPQNCGTLNFLSSVCFPNPQTGWITGGCGTIKKTTDYGYNWNTQ